MSETDGRARPAVLVTGASKGIGAACVARLAADGYHVYAGVRKEADGAALVRASASSVTPVLLDVSDAAMIADAVSLIEQRSGSTALHAVVNNAGIAVAGPLEFLPLGELRRQLEVNVVGQIAVTQACLPLLRRAHAADERAGRIVFMSSVSGRSALPFTGAYAASKFALEAAADSLRVELLPFGLRVVLVEPGVITTPIWETSRAVAERMLEQAPPQLMEYYGRAMDALRRRIIAGMKGLPPERVADIVARSLRAKTPRTRYVVGRDARTRLVMESLLPTSWRDRVVSGRVKRI